MKKATWMLDARAGEDEQCNHGLGKLGKRLLGQRLVKRSVGVLEILVDVVVGDRGNLERRRRNGILKKRRASNVSGCLKTGKDQHSDDQGASGKP